MDSRAESPCLLFLAGGDLELAGIKGENDNGVVCCPPECGQCGGAGCGKADGGNKACCINGVLQNQPHCYVEDAPCVWRNFDGEPIRRKSLYSAWLFAISRPLWMVRGSHCTTAISRV